MFSQRYERGSTLLTSNLPFDEWTEVFGSERLTGALLDRLTHHVHILEMNGDSYRLNQSKTRRKSSKIPDWYRPSQPWLTRWVHRDLPRALLRQRLMRALRQAARVPPMDYRDNPQRPM